MCIYKVMMIDRAVSYLQRHTAPFRCCRHGHQHPPHAIINKICCLPMRISPPSPQPTMSQCSRCLQHFHHHCPMYHGHLCLGDWGFFSAKILKLPPSVPSCVDAWSSSMKRYQLATLSRCSIVERRWRCYSLLNSSRKTL